MNRRSREIIKQLNRLVNDRSLPLHARNKINVALRHIRELQIRLTEATAMDEATQD
jgi:uncharacterized protein (UPF0147 family)